MMNLRTCSFPLFAALFFAVAAPALTGCRSTYYSAMETFGKHKRDLLVDRVEAAREDQEQAKEQFRTALDKFSEVVRLRDTDLKAKYETLQSEYERSKSRAEDVSSRIDSIEKVSEDLFEEWASELKQYSSDDLRRSSERQLHDTRQRYEDLIDAMKRAEAKMQPVLDAFRDHVLYLKHNLNAQAVASLQGEVATLEADTAALIREMEAAIAEADEFIRQMRSEGA